MKIAYQYRLKPTASLIQQMNHWLELLRKQYNYRLAQRFDWWEYNRCLINACPLTCSVVEPKEQPNYYLQATDLPNTKQLFLKYKSVYSQVLQECVKRLEKTFERYIKGDCNGKRLGKPRFKGVGRYRSFTYPQLKQECIQGNKINLPKIGLVKFVPHRPIPNGYKLKTAIISKKADEWYITFSLEDKSAPDQPEINIIPTEANSIGIDAGLEYFIACSDGTTERPPKFYRQREQKLAKFQNKRDDRPKGSTARRKLNNRIAKLHQKIARQRRQWQFELANKVLDKADVIFVEDLKVSKMARRNKPKSNDKGGYDPNGQAAKSGLNKSFHDAGIAGYLNEVLPYKAGKAGKLVKKVNPSGTSQHCGVCLNRVPKELGDRWHSCSNCNASMPRDVHSGLVFQKVGLGIRLTQKRESSKSRRGEACAVA